MRVSVGVAWSRGETCSAEDLVATADEAMYESKRGGRGTPKLLRQRGRTSGSDDRRNTAGRALESGSVGSGFAPLGSRSP